MASEYTEQDILEYLDKCVVYNPGCSFMELDHGYFYTANSRLTLFADETRWAIVFEKSGYANRAHRIQLELGYFGNCLSNLQAGGQFFHFTYNHHWLTLVDADDLKEIEIDFDRVSPTATKVRLRGNYVPIPNKKEDYKKWIPNILTREYPEKVAFEDLGRYLAFEYESKCRATHPELRACIPVDIPLLLHIDQWHTQEYHYIPAVPPIPQLPHGRSAEIIGEVPSAYETYPLIAKVLVAREPALFKPTLPPNNHWSNWPEAGAM